MRAVLARIRTKSCAQPVLQMVIGKMAQKVETCEVAIGANFALWKPLVVQLRITLWPGWWKSCSLITNSTQLFLLAKTVGLALLDELHVHLQVACVSLQEVLQDVVLQAVVEEQRDAGVACERAPWTHIRLAVRQVLIDGVPHMQNQVLHEVHVVVERFVTELAAPGNLVRRSKLCLEVPEGDVEMLG